MSRTGDQAFREIQALARREARGNTQVVLEQFVHERFLARHMLPTDPTAAKTLQAMFIWLIVRALTERE